MTTTIEYEDEAELRRKIIAIAEAMGLTVVDRITYEPCKAVSQRFGFKNPSVLTMKLKRYSGDLLVREGPTGRIQEIHVTPKLARYLRGEKEQ